MQRNELRTIAWAGIAVCLATLVADVLTGSNRFWMLTAGAITTGVVLCVGLWREGRHS